ncbi:hypothetical protein VTN77DRAFT_5292 [Rasamsonia byssochlamydoides]|uniref:uncharacterized protein n=1 Tax=Rasamsonia byssochlamydoides TaxID=89139 RepID=UPI003743E247
MVMRTVCFLACILFGFYPFGLALDGRSALIHRQAQQANSSAVLVDFQVYKPVEFDPESTSCNEVLLLMDHQFAFSYGQPFVGNYEPPACDFDTVRINLTVTSQGRQYDRLALMFLGDTEVFRTSTAEPTINGIIWTYIKEMSQYLALWKSPQKLIFDLGNLIDSTYTGPYNVTLTASFTKENNVRVADVILPISSRQSANNASSAFTVPSDNATVALNIPQNASRATVSISACGQSTEEFWWSNVLSQDTDDFDSTVGELYGYSPFREIQLLIDGVLAGVVWPFPIIFTGGVAPGFWRPIVGIDAFDLREPEIDISPFLPLLTDGKAHSFQIKVAGLNTPPNGSVMLTQSVGSYWVVTGKVFVYLDDGTADNSVNASERGVLPKVIAPEPKFTVTRNLVQNSQTGANETLSYSVKVDRTLSITSSRSSWTQTLSYSNIGLLNQQGLSQRNTQSTVGESSSSGIGLNGTATEYRTTFNYPLDVNTTYTISETNFTISALMSRGLEITSNGGLGISTYTLTSGPSDLQTQQWGTAYYYSITGGSSFSSGDTTDKFTETSGGTTYNRFVRAVNGTVIENGQTGEPISSLAQSGWRFSPGRPSVRSILGRGPGTVGG